MQAADSSIRVPSDDLPAAVPGLIEAAVAAFDADRDNSRRYLLRASALLSLKRRADGSASTARSKSRGGLLAWQMKRVVEYIETRLTDQITATDLANHIDVSVGAPVQGISPHDRHEPLGLASCDDSPIRALRTAPTSVRDIENDYRT